MYTYNMHPLQRPQKNENCIPHLEDNPTNRSWFITIMPWLVHPLIMGKPPLPGWFSITH